MKKEKLTIDNIKKDLIVELKECCKELVGMAVAFIIVLLLVLICSNSLNTLKAIFLWLLCCCGEAALLVLIVKQIKKATVLYKNLKNNNAIVIDKLIYSETKLKRHGRITVTYYYLCFSQYGKFQMPDENYKWSSTFSMSAEGVYNYSNNGDEFYLVLSKPHTGKILFAYNTKMFELEN